MLRARVVIWALALYILLAERLILRMETGGRGLLPLLAIATPVAIFAFGILPSGWRSFRFLLKRDFWVYWGLYIALKFLLPIVGVLLHGYPLRTLLSLLEAGLPLLFIWVGTWIANRPGERFELFRCSLVFLIVVQFICAAGQYLYVNYNLDIPLLAAQFSWDRSSQALYSENLPVGRSIGTYVNPNTLGFWGFMAFWTAALLLKERQRAWSAMLSMLILLLSQSRVAIVAMGASLIAFAFTRVTNMLVGNMKVRIRTVTNVFAVVIVAIFFAILAMSQAIIGINIPGTERLTDMIRVFGAGLGEDPNWDARVLAWKEALDLYREVPWGTLGPPELMLGHFIDSEWVRLLVQGGVALVCAYILSLLGGLRYLTYRKPEKSFLAMASVGLVILSITSTPMGYPPIALYWVCVGLVLANRHTV